MAAQATTEGIYTCAFERQPTRNSDLAGKRVDFGRQTFDISKASPERWAGPMSGSAELPIRWVDEIGEGHRRSPTRIVPPAQPWPLALARVVTWRCRNRRHHHRRAPPKRMNVRRHDSRCALLPATIPEADDCPCADCLSLICLQSAVCHYITISIHDGYILSTADRVRRRVRDCRMHVRVGKVDALMSPSVVAAVSRMT